MRHVPLYDRESATDVSLGELLQWIGADLEQEGMLDTPKRFVGALLEMTSGHNDNPADILKRQFSSDGYDEIVAVRGIEFVSVCEHHLLPFSGLVDFAYLPGPRIVGLSKIPRLVGCLSRRLQIQERLTQQIAEYFGQSVKSQGIAVVVEAEHSCMSCRGVRSRGRMVTSVMRGAFRDKPEARAEVLGLLGRS